MFRKPVFWVLFCLASTACAAFSLSRFGTAFPLLSVDIKIDRGEALSIADAVAAKTGAGPRVYRHAAVFDYDQAVKNYVELEAGGSRAFQRMLDRDLYQPYTWKVRHFNEGEAHECTIYIRPEGKPYGFAEWLPENAPGPALAEQAARALAETSAAADWGLDLTGYRLIESAREEKPGGRVDHTFEYERTEERVGEGRYRLALELSGDKLTYLRHYVKVPESFWLKYREMRSANETVAGVAWCASGILYMFGGVFVGLLVLLRKYRLTLRAPLAWGAFIGLLGLLESVSGGPADWMGYDTSVSMQAYRLQNVCELVADFLFRTFRYTVFFMAAEGLTRAAFPKLVHFWQLPKPQVAGSNRVLGQTAAGYLMVGLEFGYLVGLYIVTSSLLGWWTPSDQLADPNVLATAVPWLPAVAGAFQAGFAEECIYRALPIAGAALIGARIGRRRLLVGIGVLAQAVIFGALHADYAAQPAYARLVELFVPSVCYGLIYLRFGLLPCIIAHFTYDAVLISLPLMVSSASGVRADKLIVVFLVLLPLLYAAGMRFGGAVAAIPLPLPESFSRRLRRRGAGDLDPSAFNAAQLASAGSSRPKGGELVSAGPIPKRALAVVLCAGLTGATLWAAFTRFDSDAPPLAVTRPEAESIAREALAGKGVRLDERWRTLSTVVEPTYEDGEFVWQEGGRDRYRSLIGDYIEPPQWEVRFAVFEGDLESRREEYRVYVDGVGRVINTGHVLPESSPGARLDEAPARALAMEAVRRHYGLDSAAVEEISAESTERDHRRDWRFTFSDPAVPLPEKGQARTRVDIAGDEVVHHSRGVHVPEDWSRENRRRESVRETFGDFRGQLFALTLLVGAAFAVFHWARRQYDSRAFFAFFAALASLQAVSFLNGWPALAAGFSAIEPISNQVMEALADQAYSLLLMPVSVALLAGLVSHGRQSEAGGRMRRLVPAGVGAGVFTAGLGSFLGWVFPACEPFWGEYSSAAAFSPLLQGPVSAVDNFLRVSVFLLLVVHPARLVSNGTRLRQAAGALLSAVLWMCLDGDSTVAPGHELLVLLAGGLAMGFLYVVVYRRHLATIPVAAATASILGLAREAFLNLTPAAVPACVISIAAVGLAATLWFRQLTGSRNARSTAGQSDGAHVPTAGRSSPLLLKG